MEMQKTKNTVLLLLIFFFIAGCTSIIIIGKYNSIDDVKQGTDTNVDADINVNDTTSSQVDTTLCSH